MVNHDRYGGGGIYNFYCTFTADNQFHEYLFIHEFGHSFGGRKDTVILDAGQRNRIEVGHLLTIQKEDVDLRDGRKKVTFDGEKFGRVLIYKVFRDYSLGLVLDSRLQVEINDKIVTP